MKTKARAIQGLFVAVALAAPIPVWANAGTLPDSADVLLRPGDTNYLALEATFGLLLSPDGSEWRWACHEALVPPASSATPEFFENADGVLFGTVGGTGVAVDPNETVFRSTDGGCNWSTVSGLTDIVIWDIAFDPNDATHAFGGSANLEANAFNGIYVSSDSGASWSKTSLDLQERLFLSVETSPTNSNVIWATAAWFGTDPPLAYVYRSGDGGATFDEHPFLYKSVQPVDVKTDTLIQPSFPKRHEVIAYVVGVSPTDDLTAWIRVDGLATDWLLRTTDGGVTYKKVWTVNDNIIDFEVEADGTAWAVASVEGLFRSTDGVTFELVPDTPLVRGLDSDSRGLIAAVSQLADGFAAAISTDDGASFTPQFSFQDLAGPNACPAGSQSADICDPLWPALAQQLGIGTPTPTPTPSPTPGNGGDDPGCSCIIVPSTARTAATGILLLTLGALGLLRRKEKVT